MENVKTICTTENLESAMEELLILSFVGILIIFVATLI